MAKLESVPAIVVIDALAERAMKAEKGWITAEAKLGNRCPLCGWDPAQCRCLRRLEAARASASDGASPVSGEAEHHAKLREIAATLLAEGCCGCSIVLDNGGRASVHLDVSDPWAKFEIPKVDPADRLEAAFWRFDALHKAHYRQADSTLPGPMSERDAFKRVLAEVLAALPATSTPPNLAEVSAGITEDITRSFPHGAPDALADAMIAHAEDAYERGRADERTDSKAVGR